MIDYLEHHSPKYPGRTSDNVIESDCTIAFALNFESSGEKLTKHYCKLYQKLYIPVDAAIITTTDIDKIIRQLEKYNVSTINVAGNSLYTFNKYMPKCTQDVIDKVIYNTLSSVQLHYAGITQIRSGGQSGADEAGLKAAIRMGIPAFCLCPKGWPFLTIDGETIRDENKFKARFNIAA